MRFGIKTAPQNTTYADMLAVWQAARSTARGRLELPEPIAYLPELGMVVQGAVAGRPLAHFGPADDWHGAIRQVAEALAAFHDLDVRELAPRPLADHVRRTCHPGPQVLTNWYPELAVLIQRAEFRVVFLGTGKITGNFV